MSDKLPMPVICECGFNTMDAGEANRHAEEYNDGQGGCKRAHLTAESIEKARAEKPCPRCGATNHRSRTDAGGGKDLIKCCKCRAQWQEKKGE